MRKLAELQQKLAQSNTLRLKISPFHPHFTFVARAIILCSSLAFLNSPHSTVPLCDSGLGDCYSIPWRLLYHLGWCFLILCSVYCSLWSPCFLSFADVVSLCICCYYFGIYCFHLCPLLSLYLTAVASFCGSCCWLLLWVSYSFCGNYCTFLQWLSFPSVAGGALLCLLPLWRMFFPLWATVVCLCWRRCSLFTSTVADVLFSAGGCYLPLLEEVLSSVYPNCGGCSSLCQRLLFASVGCRRPRDPGLVSHRRFIPSTPTSLYPSPSPNPSFTYRNQSRHPRRASQPRKPDREGVALRRLTHSIHKPKVPGSIPWREVSTRVPEVRARRHTYKWWSSGEGPNNGFVDSPESKVITIFLAMINVLLMKADARQVLLSPILII